MPAREREALALAEKATKHQAVSATTRTGGESSDVYEIALESHPAVIVRLHSDSTTYATTRRNLETLFGLGLPVPQVLYEEPGALVLEKIPGIDLRFVLPSLTDEQVVTIARQVAGYQRRVIENLPVGSGYGWVGIGETGPHATWKDTIGLDRPANSRLADAAQHLEDYFASVLPTCHLDDITGKNVLIDNGALAGLVDFDVVCYGDPCFWLGLTAAGVLTDCGERELRYSDALIDAFGVTPLERRAVAFYSARIATEFHQRFSNTENEAWAAAMQAGIERWLQEAMA